MRSTKFFVFSFVLASLTVLGAFASGVTETDGTWTLIAPGEATLEFLAQHGVNVSPLRSPGTPLDAQGVRTLHTIHETEAADTLRDLVTRDLFAARQDGSDDVAIRIGTYFWRVHDPVD